LHTAVTQISSQRGPCCVSTSREHAASLAGGQPFSLGFAASYATKKGGKAGKGGKGDKGGSKEAASADGGDAAAAEFSMAPFEKLMSAAVSHFQGELGKIHAGRASPGLLEPVEVSGHSERLPLRAYATVTVRSPSLLAVSVHNPQDTELVAAAIRSSPLRLSARVEGKEIVVPVPRPTLDGLKAMGKLVAQEAEKAKSAIRVARHKALKGIEGAIKADDAVHRAEKEVQKAADRMVAEVDRLKAAKEKELAEH